MAYYENVFIVRQDLSPSQAEALEKSFEQLIEQNGGKVTSTEYWGLRTLAYPIKKNKKGHYILLNIDAPASVISELERHMNLNEDILRNLTIKLEKKPEGPSVMMRQKARQD